FRGAGGEPPRRKRLWGLHLSRHSRRSLALPLQSTLDSFVLKTTTFTKRAFKINKKLILRWSFSKKEKGKSFRLLYRKKLYSG
ncbi:hypothetical protein P4502_24270, partial [Peribacillus frigoritolerans]|uniref:hypothetical protein n=1 Tax=Peribacillus frigoritolerans TaxID=450367 RepID=UPI002E22926E|nr:hypothetical protein [Peribacillus frigoritolerans]